MKDSPFSKFFRRGMNVTLSTDDPLLFHMSNDPLLEEYSVARASFDLSMTDMCELARNSIYQSGFEDEKKKEWLGKKYKAGVKHCDVDKTHVPLIRAKFRAEVSRVPPCAKDRVCFLILSLSLFPVLSSLGWQWARSVDGPSSAGETRLALYQCLTFFESATGPSPRLSLFSSPISHFSHTLSSSLIPPFFKRPRLFSVSNPPFSFPLPPTPQHLAMEHMMLKLVAKGRGEDVMKEMMVIFEESRQQHKKILTDNFIEVPDGHTIFQAGQGEPKLE